MGNYLAPEEVAFKLTPSDPRSGIPSPVIWSLNFPGHQRMAMPHLSMVACNPE